jgi:hypothetical protein
MESKTSTTATEQEAYWYTLYTLSTLSGRVSTPKKGENDAQNDAQKG